MSSVLADAVRVWGFAVVCDLSVVAYSCWGTSCGVAYHAIEESGEFPWFTVSQKFYKTVF